MAGRALSSSEQVVWSSETGVEPIPFIECTRHVAIALRLSNAREPERLVRSIESIVDRHAMLRAAFRDGRRFIAPPGQFSIDTQDLSDCAPETVTGTVASAVNRPFDLSNGPLFRAMLARASHREHVLVLVAHHIVFDGWSKRIVMGELGAFYAALSGTGPLPPAMPTTYDDYVKWQHDSYSTSSFREDERFWLDNLMDAADVRLSHDAPASCDGGRARSARRTMPFDPEFVDAVRDYSRQRGVTFAVTILAAVTLLIHRRTGSTDVTIGVPIADRPRREFENVVGLMMNVLPVRTELHAARTFDELVAVVRDNFATAYAHRAMPYGRLIESLAHHAGCRRWPFRVVVNIVNIPTLPVALPAIQVETLTPDLDVASAADISLHIHVKQAVWRCTVLYQRSRLTDLKARAIFEDLVEILRAGVESPGGRAW